MSIASKNNIPNQESLLLGSKFDNKIDNSKTESVQISRSIDNDITVNQDI